MNKIISYIFLMALVTYAVRMLPFVLFRKKITSVYIRSVLHYIPYAVLSAMVIPDFFFSTGAQPENIIAALCGFITAVILSYIEKSLLTVALSSCGAVYMVSVIIKYLPI